MTEEDMRKLILSFGIEPKYGTLLAHNDAASGEQQSYPKEKTIVGKRTLRDYFEANKEIWIKEDNA